MKPVLEKVEVNFKHSFHVNHIKADRFSSSLHFHPEVELLLILKGTGTRILGDSVKPYSPGSLIMIGSNVPHVWYSDIKEETDDSKQNKNLSEAIYIAFDTAIFGNTFWELIELQGIKELISNAVRGIELLGDTRKLVASKMKKMDQLSRFSRITNLFIILETIANSKENKYITSAKYHYLSDNFDIGVLNKLFEFVIKNYSQDITLKMASEAVNLSTSSFCRYFKSRTNKTFIQFLNEVRISNATRLLIDENLSVSDVCFKCGYNSVSYFTKQFKIIKNCTPAKYRKKILLNYSGLK